MFDEFTKTYLLHIGKGENMGFQKAGVQKQVKPADFSIQTVKQSLWAMIVFSSVRPHQETSKLSPELETAYEVW